MTSLTKMQKDQERWPKGKEMQSGRLQLEERNKLAGHENCSWKP